jgi:hypothetical protein
MNAKHLRHALILIAALSTACDGGAPEEPEIQRLGDGFVVVSPSDEPVLAHRDASVFVDLPDAGTEAWEPGNGYFARNEDDPETQVYYDSCDTSSASPASSELVDRVLVDADTQTLQWSSLVTFVPEIEGVTIINAATGEPMAVGDELEPKDCEYSSSYAYCETETVSFDFSAVPFPGPPIDARLINTVESQLYWDYGQDRFRVIRHGQTACEGASCATHPFVVNFLNNIGASEPCESWGMAVYNRVPTPLVE